MTAELTDTYQSMALLLECEPPQRDVAWLRAALQWGVTLEFATIPAYLYALWSIKEPNSDPNVADMILEIVMEEMLHMALACNMLSAIGGVPKMAEAGLVPAYPTALPGGVKPGLVVSLSGIASTSGSDQDVIKVFMDLEAPEKPLARTAETFPTIGKFYAAILEAFKKPENFAEFGAPGPQLNSVIAGFELPDMTTTKDNKKVVDLTKVERAVKLITEQGEGSDVSPNSGGELAHYYRFGEIFHGRKLKQHPGKKWKFDGDSFPRPAVHPLGTVPRGGWNRSAASDSVKAKLDAFNTTYRELLVKLEQVWQTADPKTPFKDSIVAMKALEGKARELVTIALPAAENQPGRNYGPEFRLPG
ncbi:ferritin-like domain-containing protein [Saccharothrix hoggarensis]|uniref:Ferritin-like protein n=1 Tax=Saccharothrix hoggarensis TaxID=913853 RepID=A0ABW3QW91_9PSEU